MNVAKLKSSPVLTYAIGPVITLALLSAIHRWPDVLGASAALAFVPLVWAGYTAGIYPALASSFIIIGYAVHFYSPDYSRIAQISVSVVAIAVMTGELKRRATLSDTLNGNLKRLKEAVQMVHNLKLEWDNLSDTGKYRQVELIEDRLGNLAALIFGWLTIGKEIRKTQEFVGMEDND